MNKDTYSVPQLLEAVQKSKSIAQTMRILNLKPSGSHYTRFHNKIKERNIDISHFTSPVNRIANNKFSKECVINKWLIRGSKVKSWSLKQKLFEFGFRVNECCLCGNNGMWNNKSLVLHLDHIDGDKRNNTLINLRILCPNCHSQTETFGVKNKKNMVLLR